MGKVKTIELPDHFKKQIKGSVKSVLAIRPDYIAYTHKEVKNYLRMYLSGYTMKEVAEHYNVPVHRAQNSVRRHFSRNMKYWARMSKLNRMRRLGGLKLITVSEWEK